MSIENDNLLNSLQAGFIGNIRSSKGVYMPQILVNDSKSGIKILSTIQSELLSCSQFWMSVAFVTTSGVVVLKNELLKLQKEGKKGQILVSQYLNFTQPEALKELLKFDNIELKIVSQGNFHSKGYIFDKGAIYNLIIGSSNLTDSALSSNKELNIKVSGTQVSPVISDVMNGFRKEFDTASIVNDDFIEKYEVVYKKQLQKNREIKKILESDEDEIIVPNKMQIEAIKSLNKLRQEGKSKAILISATGTGKTFLGAFDAKQFDAKRLLFIVHRDTIVQKSLHTFKAIFGSSRSYGLYSGKNLEIDKDFLFSTIQTISRDNHLNRFKKDEFDYIIIDETHRVGADSYQTVLEYFKPKFLLGMTATPERTDKKDIIKDFDYNIAYEIRLNQALEEEMLVPFHYFGIHDMYVDDKLIESKTDFNKLIIQDRINHILEKIEFYSTDNGVLRGLVFCSSKDECKAMSEEFNKKNFRGRNLRTTYLTSDNKDSVNRSEAIDKLESNDLKNKLDLIFTYDVFNEGVDIPKANLVVLMRPTQSAIVFVQQLGRGLRKSEGKEYLTVLDFIGNYKNNYLIPIALFGDTSYQKDSLRKYILNGSNLIPGSSTINFDEISKKKIFESINSANFNLKSQLDLDYKNLKNKIGKQPMMLDFIENGVRDPFFYVEYSDSYFNYSIEIEKDSTVYLQAKEKRILEYYSFEINNAKRVLESFILNVLIDESQINIDLFISKIKNRYGFEISEADINSSINNLNLGYTTEKKDKNIYSVKDIYGYKLFRLNWEKNIICRDVDFEDCMKNDNFKKYLKDSVSYSLKQFDKKYKDSKFINGFLLYEKYSRKDVFRILNWESKPVEQNVGGYMISKDKKNCALFVNYYKDPQISETTKYKDYFINPDEFMWMSKSKRNLESNDVQTIYDFEFGLRIPLFIKKYKKEGLEFYYMGDLTPLKESFEIDSIKNETGEMVSVVKIKFKMQIPVDENIFQYLTTQ